MPPKSSSTMSLKYAVQPILGEEETVYVAIAAFQLDESRGRGADSQKPRYLVFTEKQERKKDEKRFRLHKVKRQGTSYSISRSWHLENLKQIDGDQSDALGFTFTFDKEKFSFIASGMEDKNELIWCIIQVCQDAYNALPKVYNINLVELSQLAERKAFNIPYQSQTTMTKTTIAAAAEVPPPVEMSVMTEVDIANLEGALNESESGDAGALAERLKQSIAMMEEANIHAILNAEEFVVDVVARFDEMEGELTAMGETLDAYNEQVQDMRRDIGKINDRSVRMEVTAKNHKALLQETQSLIKRLDGISRITTPLKTLSLEDPDDVPAITDAAKMLHDIAALPEELLNITAVQEGMAEMEELRQTFQSKLEAVLRKQFRKLADALAEDKSRLSKKHRLKLDVHTKVHDTLQVYEGLMGWIQETNPTNATSLQQEYTGAMQVVYIKEFREFTNYLPSSMVKEKLDSTLEGITHGGKMAERTRRGSDSAESIESASSDSSRSSSVRGGGGGSDKTKDRADIQFQYMIQKMVNVMESEQTFCAEFFHLISLEPDDTVMADKLSRCMQAIFGNIAEQCTNVIAAADGMNHLYLLGMHAETERLAAEYSDTSKFIFGYLIWVQSSIRLLFNKYCDKIIKKLKETKVTAKRSGILWAVHNFPYFCEKLYEALGEAESTEIVDGAIQKISQALFTWIDKIAETDQKYVDLVKFENYHHYIAQMTSRNYPILQQSLDHARELYARHKAIYVNWIIKSQFTRLMEFCEGIEGLLKTIPAKEVQFRLQFNRQELQKMLKTVQGQVDKGLVKMRERVEKHMCEEEQLLEPIWRDIKTAFRDMYLRANTLLGQCYPDENLNLDSLEDLKNL